MTDLFDCDKLSESLTHKDVNSAVDHMLDGLPCDLWPDMLKVYAWNREKLRWSAHGLAGLICARAMELLDEEYGHPDELSTVSNYAFALAQTFAENVIAEYKVWSCERAPSDDVTVNVARWVRENKRAWLDKPDVRAWVDARSSSEMATCGPVGVDDCGREVEP